MKVVHKKSLKTKIFNYCKSQSFAIAKTIDIPIDIARKNEKEQQIYLLG
jgi:hypothetical protein